MKLTLTTRYWSCARHGADRLTLAAVVGDPETGAVYARKQVSRAIEACPESLAAFAANWLADCQARIGRLMPISASSIVSRCDAVLL